MTTHFADRLHAAVAKKKTPAVVAIDPVIEHLPPDFQRSTQSVNDSTSDAENIRGIFAFCRRVIQLVAPIVPVVKLNSAYFECYHAAGIQAYDDLIMEAKRQGLLVIGDIKRGDVGHTAEMYAAAHLGKMSSVKNKNADVDRFADAVTINGYPGIDGVMPFVRTASQTGRGIFVLVRTSNPSAAAIQDLATIDGSKLHERVAAMVADCAATQPLGHCGYSHVGAVTATRNLEHAQALRQAMPQSFLLVPGYGAQGGTAKDFAPYFDSNRPRSGALIVAGRSVLFAHENPRYQDANPKNWGKCLEQACQDFAADVAQLLA